MADRNAAAWTFVRGVRAYPGGVAEARGRRALPRAYRPRRQRTRHPRRREKRGLAPPSAVYRGVRSACFYGNDISVSSIHTHLRHNVLYLRREGVGSGMPGAGGTRRSVEGIAIACHGRRDCCQVMDTSPEYGNCIVALRTLDFVAGFIRKTRNLVRSIDILVQRGFRKTRGCYLHGYCPIGKYCRGDAARLVGFGESFSQVGHHLSGARGLTSRDRSDV